MKPQIMHDSWYVLLKDYFEKEHTKKVLMYLRKNYKIICPDIPNVFRAFSLPLSDVKCIVIGIGPYSDGSATGLAMATTEGKMNPSLEILSEARSIYHNDPSINGQIDTSLEYLHEQGVMLLNCYLTTEKFRGPRHHENLWKNLMPFLLNKLSTEKQGIIYCLWGNEAKEMKHHIFNIGNYVLEACHPVATYRQLQSRGTILDVEDKLNFFKFDHFNLINQILESNEQEKIEW